MWPRFKWIRTRPCNVLELLHVLISNKILLWIVGIIRVNIALCLWTCSKLIKVESLFHIIDEPLFSLFDFCCCLYLQYCPEQYILKLLFLLLCWLYACHVVILVISQYTSKLYSEFRFSAYNPYRLFYTRLIFLFNVVIFSTLWIFRMKRSNSVFYIPLYFLCLVFSTTLVLVSLSSRRYLLSLKHGYF